MTCEQSGLCNNKITDTAKIKTRLKNEHPKTNYYLTHYYIRCVTIGDYLQILIDK